MTTEDQYRAGLSHSAQQHINAGLADIERQRRGEPIATAKGSPVTVKDLVDRARQVARARRQAKARLKAIAEHLDKWRDSREKALAHLSEELRAELIAAELPGERDKALGIYTDDFVKHWGDIRLAAKSLDATARIFRDARAYIDVETLGSGKRSVFDRQLDGVQPARLADALLKADATGDRDLFAAAAAKLGNLSKRDQELVGTRVNVHSIAQSLAGDDLKQAAAAIAFVQYAAEEARYDADELAGKPHSSSAKLEVAGKRLIVENDGGEAYLAEKEPSPPSPEYEFAIAGTFAE